MALACFAGICIPGRFFAPASQTNGPQRPSAGISPEEFIAAFDLTPQGDFRFTWPPESMRPASYKRVLLVVERMPQGWQANQLDGPETQLSASKHLRVNGQPAKPLPPLAEQSSLESRDSTQRFLVTLDQGRIRIKLLVPPELTLNPLRNNARIRIYRHVGSN